MRIYELVFIAQPELDEEHMNALVEQVQQVITTNGGEMLKTELIGRRRLAYPIRKRREGFYVLMNANMEAATLKELDRALKLSEDVLRSLTVRIDEMTE